MKQFFDFLPIVIFFLVFKFPEASLGIVSPILTESWFTFFSQAKPMILATAALIPLTMLQVTLGYAITRKVEMMHVVALSLLIVFGGFTIAFQNEAFLIWKVTIVNWIFASVLIVSDLFTEKNLMERLMGEKIDLGKSKWKTLNHMWVAYFIFLGAINLVVAFNFSLDTWVDFKLFGMLGLTFVFIIIQGIYLSKQMKDDPTVQP